MAEIIGISGAWGEIAGDLLRRGIKLAKPGDIEPLLLYSHKNFKLLVEKKTAEAAGLIKVLEDRITELRGAKGFFRTIMNSFGIFKCKARINQINSRVERYIKVLTDNIAYLESLQHSPALAGAQAELDVIAQLGRLPAGYTVFNDVRLRARRYIYFDGAAIQSAQIDHLVLCPAGIFVIETKEWSKNFVESGDYHDPFDQVKRSSYLCYDTVKQFGKVQVRSIIACAGHLPAKPGDSKAKVLKVPELAGYISWFKEKELGPELLAELKQYLGKKAGAFPQEI